MLIQDNLEKERMEAWNLTAQTILHVDAWKELFKEAGYTGDYYWFSPMLLLRDLHSHVCVFGWLKRQSRGGIPNKRCAVNSSVDWPRISRRGGWACDLIDLVVSTHRGHAHYLGKGGNLTAMIAEIYGKAIGCSGGRGGSMHLIDIERVLRTTALSARPRWHGLAIA